LQTPSSLTVSTQGGNIDLGTTTVYGNLTGTSNGGNMTQTGPLIVYGDTNLNSSGGSPQNQNGDITLTNAGNNFGGTVSMTGANMALVDSTPLNLGTVSSTGNLSVTGTGGLSLGTTSVGGSLTAVSGNGDITQTGVLQVTGNSILTAGSGDITLTNAGNNFVGVVASSGNNLVLTDGTGGIVLGATNATGSLRVASPGGAISQPQPYISSNRIQVAGNADFTSSATSMLLDPNNGYGGVVTQNGVPIRATAPVFSSAPTLTPTSTQVLSVAPTPIPTLASTITSDPTPNVIESRNTVASATIVINTSSAANYPGNSPALLPVAGLGGNTGANGISGSMLSSSSSSSTVSNVTTSITSIEASGTASTLTSSVGTSAGVTNDLGGAPAGQGINRTLNSTVSNLRVDLVKPIALTESGLVRVDVPKGNNVGFTFDLPTEIKQEIINVSATPRALQLDGLALPSWLKFDSSTLRFTAVGVPEGALPFTAQVVTGSRKVVVEITEFMQ